MNLSAPNAYPQVGGRWRNFTVLGVILLLIFGFYKAVRGYKIEFVCEPCQVNKPHGIVFSDEEKKLIDFEVQKMLQKGAIRRASFDPRQFISTCLLYKEVWRS